VCIDKAGLSLTFGNVAKPVPMYYGPGTVAQTPSQWCHRCCGS